MSFSEPALINEPKPPRRFGHRNAIVPPPNSAANTSTDVMSARRWKSRRDMTLTGLPGGASAGVSETSRAARRNDIAM